MAGVSNPDALAELARGRLRAKLPQLSEALNRRFSDHHAFLARLHLEMIDQRTSVIDEVTARIEDVIGPLTPLGTSSRRCPGSPRGRHSCHSQIEENGSHDAQRPEVLLAAAQR